MILRTSSPELNAENKKFGRFYTPKLVAQAIADWAVSTSNCTVLDPSFGGCAFLQASITALSKIGAPKPARLIYGVDNDPGARKYLAHLVGLGADLTHFHTEDFLKIRPTEIPGAPYHAVIGNPPYVRHHQLEDKFQIRKDLGLENGSSPSARASYWVYFVIHSLKFIAPKGRLALVLPGAFAHSDYAESVRRILLDSFESITVVFVRERLFHDAQESSVLLLAKGRAQNNREVRVGLACTKEEVKKICSDVEHYTKLVEPKTGTANLLSALISPAASGIYEALRRDSRVIPLSQVAEIRIGTVTGCNAFFTIADSVRRRLRLPQRFVAPIVVRASCLRGLVYRHLDHERLRKSAARAVLLLIQNKDGIGPLLRNYLEVGKKAKIHTRYKCRNRTPWYSVRYGGVPDAFLHYMSARAPRIVINRANATCTNAIHGLFWKKELSVGESRSLALASANTLFHLSAELQGRPYGGGVLKIEPTEARDLLLVPLPDASATVMSHFTEVDKLLRRGEDRQALELVNKVTLSASLGLSHSQIDDLQQACNILRSIRLPSLTN